MTGGDPAGHRDRVASSHLQAGSRPDDLRVDSSKDPVGELRTLFDAYKAAFKIK